MKNNNNNNKVVFVWVLVTFLICTSMTFARTVKQMEMQQDLEKRQLELDYPVLENWPAGGGDNAVWVNPDQDKTDGVDLPSYKVSLDNNESAEDLAAPTRLDKKVGKIDLFSW